MSTGLTDRSNRLREWREQRGWTLSEMSRLLGLSVAMLSRVERGERQLRPETRVLIARRLRVRVDHLFPAEPLERP